MLKPHRISKNRPAGGAGRRFAIVASEYNALYVDSMLEAARRTLLAAGGKVEIIRVPGAFEIPAVAAALADGDHGRLDAVLCLGVILRGATTHAQHIGDAVTHALVELQIRHGLPVIHEVLLLENEAQARARCLDPKHNRGIEAAQTALAMAEVMSRLRGRGKGRALAARSGARSRRLE